MVVDLEQKEKDEKLLREANALKKRQDRVTSRFKNLEKSDRRHFQSDFVHAQAKEICNYLRDMSLSPLQSWHAELKELIEKGSFMEKFYLTIDEFEQIVPDIVRIKKLILPVPPTEDEVRTDGSMDFT